MTELGLAWRRLRRRPGRGLATATTVALGVGASVAAFAALDGVLLRELPVAEQDRLVMIWHSSAARGATLRVPFRVEGFEVLRDRARMFSGMAGVSAAGTRPMTVDAASEPYLLDRTVVTGDFFDVLGVRPTLGRLLEPGDDVVGAEPVSVLSHAAWRARFGADPEVVGSVLRTDGVSLRVVGIGPAGLELPGRTEVWTAVRSSYADWAAVEPFMELHAVGRLAAGVDAGGVGASVAAELAADARTADFAATFDPVVVPLPEHEVGAARPVLMAAFGAALLLLAAAVANATLLLLAGGNAVREAAVRRALGAARPSLLLRLLAEAGLVGALGAFGGVGLAFLALRGLLPLAPAELPRLTEVGIGVRGLGFAAAAAIATTLTAAGAAALVLARSDLRSALSGASRVPDGGGGTRRAVAALQVALTVVSAAGAGLLTRTVVTLDRLDPGFDPTNLSVVALRVPYTWFDVPESYLTALERVTEELEAVPGIVAARPTLGPPLDQRLEIVLASEGQDSASVAGNPYVAMDVVLPGHLAAVGIPLRAGRDLTAADDRPGAPPVVVVDEALARALWPGEDPLGKRVNALGYPDTWFTVVGVAAATRYRQYLEVHPRAYYPLRRLGNSPPNTLLVRTAEGGPESVRALVDAAFARADPGVRVLGEAPMSTILRGPAAGRRFAAGVLLSFAAATLLLAALGVYGVFTVWVHRRTREMGVRRALGAPRERIVRLVLFSISKVAAVGAAAGLLVALWAGRLVESLLYGVSPGDPSTLLAVSLGSVGVALLAGLAPALRASATDPAVSLRAE